jgi:hypothetical protein
MDHTKDAKFLHGINAYGQMDDSGNAQIMSVAFDYFDSPGQAKAGNLKTEKFWMYRDNAIAFAEAIIRSARGQN